MLPFFFFFFFFPLLLLAAASGAGELQALMEIKSSLDPENKFLTTWTPNGDPCSGNFDGVACNSDRRVENVSLQGKGLTGKLPPAVARLKSLTGLYLHYNYLSGEVPKEIADLTLLTDLYLDVNNLSGTIPPEIGTMPSLQVLQLCCNRLTGEIPASLGQLGKLTVMALERNQLAGGIPESLSAVASLNRLYLSFNRLSGSIPAGVADMPRLEVLDVQFNNLSGVIPSGLSRLKDGFRYGNNSGLCGSGFPSVRGCTQWDYGAAAGISPVDPNRTVFLPTPANFTQGGEPPLIPSKSSPSRFPLVDIIAGAIVSTALVLTAAAAILVSTFRRRRRLGRRSELPDQPEQGIGKKRIESRGGSWEEIPAHYRLNLEEVESATHHFSEMNLLGRSKFSGVYKGILKDGSAVAIKSISKTSCKTEEDEFVDGLNLLKSLNNPNLAKLKGFCCSKDRGECFLIYEFAERGSLSQYLDNDRVLEWPTRVSIIQGIAKEYLHRDVPEKPRIVHKNISAEKVVLDENWNPLILDSGLRKILADDVVYSAIKVSAALGYMSPEYITTGKFTEKSDVYAFGVIVLQVLSGRKILSNSARAAAEAGNWEDLLDPNLETNSLHPNEAAMLAKLAVDCTDEIPENRPTMADVVEELRQLPGRRM
ncbi:hypothetical protein M569_13300 [Genlisea aurea]|uniref:Protein kinase domain-containing protein n=1 Tax=Genlisea aurea TaxID=192259 RepID=S8CAU5_9LAMI|nr:hypothetical protein M569_13300 [Genlisea aurea]